MTSCDSSASRTSGGAQERGLFVDRHRSGVPSPVASPGRLHRVLGEITGGGGYDELLTRSRVVFAFGLEIRCLELDCLIQVKRAAGRPKDLETIAELEALLEERDRPRE